MRQVSNANKLAALRVGGRRPEAAGGNFWRLGLRLCSSRGADPPLSPRGGVGPVLPPGSGTGQRCAAPRSLGTTLSRSCPPQVFLLTSVSFRAGFLFENLGRAVLPAAGGSLCSSGVLLSGISRGTNELLCPRFVTAIPRGKFCSQRARLHPELPGEDLFTCSTLRI